MIEVRQEEATRLLATVHDAAVIVTDPPYGVAYHSNRYVEKNPHAPVARDWNFQIGPFLSAAAGALRDGGALYLLGYSPRSSICMIQRLPLYRP